MFVSKSLVALLLCTIVGTTVAHPSPHVVHAHHRRHQRPREVSRRTCKSRLPSTSVEAQSVSVPATTSVPDNNAAVHTTVNTDEPAETSPAAATSSTARDDDASSSAPSSTKRPSSTKTSEASEPTKTTSSGSSGAIAALMPITPLRSWSMSSKADDSIPLSDSTLRPHNAISELLHPVVTAPDGVKAMKVTYPSGSWNFKQEPRGGMSLYAPGPSDVDLTTAKEATFGYSVLFEEGFEFNKGGKLFGLYGGESEGGAVGCSGGRLDDSCFSVRLMWRTGGKGEIYSYLPPSEEANKKVCNVAPQSDCNPKYGSSVGRGAFNFTPGKATTLSIRVRLNDVGKQNGEMELFANGKSVINVDGLVLRQNANGKIRGLQFQTFFGGSTSDWASPKEQHAYFRDYTVAITEKL